MDKTFTRPAMSLVPLGLSTLLTALVLGCAHLGGAPALDAVLADISANPGSGAYIPGVPVLEQDRRMCGPASLASVAVYYEGDGGSSALAAGMLDEVAAAVYDERLGGTLPLDLFIHAKERGYVAEFYNGGLDDLRERLRASEPVILFLNLGLDAYPAGHYAVAVGFSDRAGVVVVHWGRAYEETISYSDLERSWSKTRHSTLLIRPEGER